MSLDELAAAQHRRQQQLAVDVMKRVGKAWRLLDERELDASFRARALVPMMSAVVLGQYRAAAEGQPYVEAAVREQHTAPDPAGQVDPRAFTGVASDGRPLQTLLYEPIIRTKLLIGQGQPVDQALAGGFRQLSMIVSTQILDAARQAQIVAMKADSRVAGYYRTLSANPCSRCAVLAGKWFATAAAASFLRHPRCDCGCAPATEQNKRIAGTPERYFQSLSRAKQDEVFTKAGAQAIRDGADIGQVVNARRGMESAADIFGRPADITREGITRRGIAGKRLGESSKGVRLMPETIYRDATDRADAVRLLRRFGYII